MTGRFDRRLLTSGVLTALTVLPYTVVIFVLEAVRPGFWLFLTGSPLRGAFLVVSVISWPFLGLGAALSGLLALATRRGRRDDGQRRRRARQRLSEGQLLQGLLAFLCLDAGIGCTVAAAVLVFLGAREKFAVRGDPPALVWTVLVLAALVPAIFYALSFVTVLLWIARALHDLQAPVSFLHPDGPHPAATAPDEENSPASYEEELEQLSRMGFADREKAMAALEATNHSVHDAAWKLRNESGL